MFEDSYNIAQKSTVFPPENNEKGKFVSFNASGKPIIKVVGVGGGGDNAVTHMYEQDIEGISFVVTNTDNQALIHSSVPEKLLLGPETCGGLGAGNIPEKARMAAEESEAEIAQLFDDDTKLVFVTAGMGGGTGTGAGPVVAKVAKELGKLTIGIVTIPFFFEGQKKILKALDGADEMGKYVDALLVINNQRLTEIYPDLDIDNAFDKADDTLTVAAKSISDMINMVGKINLDFKDVETTLRDGGTAIISSGYGEGENRVTAAIYDALNSPLLKNQDIKSSKRFLFNVYYSKKSENKFRMEELEEINSFMADFAGDVDVIWGTSIDDTLGDTIKITILAAGFEASHDLPIKKPVKGRKQHIEVGTTATPATDTDTDRIANVYGSAAVAAQKGQQARSKYIILNNDQLDNDTLINFIEKNPTMTRPEPGLQKEWKSLIAATQPSDSAEQPFANKKKTKTINF